MHESVHIELDDDQIRRLTVLAQERACRPEDVASIAVRLYLHVEAHLADNAALLVWKSDGTDPSQPIRLLATDVPHGLTVEISRSFENLQTYEVNRADPPSSSFATVIPFRPRLT